MFNFFIRRKEKKTLYQYRKLILTSRTYIIYFNSCKKPTIRHALVTKSCSPS